MKKSTKILIIVGVILAVILAIICTTIIILNKGKKPITATEFKTTMEANGFELLDSTGQYSQYVDYIEQAYVAAKDGYRIEFFVLSNTDNAISMYDTNKLIFESQMEDTSVPYATSLKNYSIYSLTANSKYKYLSRIDNTLIYIDADNTYQNEIETIIKDLGY